MTPSDHPSGPPKDVQGRNEVRVIPTGDLFRGEREVWIEHDGVRYRLRVTRRNKLILQK